MSKENKSNTELLKEIQDIVDEYNSKKEDVMILLGIIDKLETRYYDLTEEIKNKK